MINIQLTLSTNPDLCKNVSLQHYLVAAVIHIQSLRRQFVHIHTYFSQYRGACRAVEIKYWESSECSVPQVRQPWPLCLCS